MKNDLKDRTKKFSLQIINFIELLPKKLAASIIAKQLVRSATSVGANYRAVCRARSDKEFIAKMNIVLEEADESCFWLELISEENWLNKDIVFPILKESNELIAIFVSTLKTINARVNKTS